MVYLKVHIRFNYHPNHIITHIFFQGVIYIQFKRLKRFNNFGMKKLQTYTDLNIKMYFTLGLQIDENLGP